MPNKNTRMQRSRTANRPQSRGRKSRQVERRVTWIFTTHSEDAAHNVAIYLSHVMGIKSSFQEQVMFRRADGSPSGSHGVSSFRVVARTLKALFEEAVQFAHEMDVQHSKLIIVGDELWTVQRLVSPERATQVSVTASRTPRMSDYLAPVGMFAGQPVYELPGPEEAERIRMHGKQQ